MRTSTRLPRARDLIEPREQPGDVAGTLARRLDALERRVEGLAARMSPAAPLRAAAPAPPPKKAASAPGAAEPAPAPTFDELATELYAGERP